MQVTPVTQQAFQLLHHGVLALSEVEANGIRIDKDRMHRTKRKVRKQIKRREEHLKGSKIYKIWKKTFGWKTSLGSGDQLAHVLYDKCGFEAKSFTEKGVPKTDDAALSGLGLKFCDQYLELKRLRTAYTRYLCGIERELVGEMLHPFFNLHTALTFRSSSESPNFQNIPIRNPKIGKLIRSLFIAREGRQLVELDYSGAEVRVAACYHHDPTMMSYLNDKTKDMHRDMAMECYMLGLDEVTKPIRYCGKNMFVFPQFYGDWYLDCARSLWEAIGSMKLETKSGVPLLDHLASKGIKELGALDMKADPKPGTFEEHLMQVERRFWKERFPVYDRWKKRWYKQYQKDGYFTSKTGFVCQGFMKRNEVINYPVQGAAFHCLLWSLIQLVKKELKKRKMKSLIVGQIHDSIVADVVPAELEEFLAIANSVMTQKIKEAFPWLIAPMEIEADVAPVGGSWFDKEEYPIPNVA